MRGTLRGNEGPSSLKGSLAAMLQFKITKLHANTLGARTLIAILRFEI